MPLPAKGWEAYYKNGSVYTSKGHKWADIPATGLIVAVIWHDYHMDGVRMKTMIGGRDYVYYVDENTWGNTNNFKDIEHLKPELIKLGVWDEEMHIDKVYRIAHEKLDM